MREGRGSRVVWRAEGRERYEGRWRGMREGRGGRGGWRAEGRERYEGR